MYTHCGTVEYIAPEIFEGDPFYGPGVDVWSFGVMLYAMVMAHLPFSSKNHTPACFAIVVQKGLTRIHCYQMEYLLSTQCRSLIAACLQVSKTSRISVPEIAAHDWMTGSGQQDPVSFVEQPRDEAVSRATAEKLQEPILIIAFTYTKAICRVGIVRFTKPEGKFLTGFSCLGVKSSKNMLLPSTKTCVFNVFLLKKNTDALQSQCNDHRVGTRKC
jgi:serine/threonine protein kinase